MESKAYSRSALVLLSLLYNNRDKRYKDFSYSEIADICTVNGFKMPRDEERKMRTVSGVISNIKTRTLYNYQGLLKIYGSKNHWEINPVSKNVKIDFPPINIPFKFTISKPKN